MLHAAGIDILGIVFNGQSTPASEDFILNYTNLNCLGKIPMADVISHEFVSTQANLIRNTIAKVYAL